MMMVIWVFTICAVIPVLDAEIFPLPNEHVQHDWMTAGQDELNKHLSTKFNHNQAKNVIMFMGDGMGVNTVTAARIYKGQSQMGVSGEEQQLFMETLPFAGLSKTYSTNKQVTDSAASATAYLCGVKTKTGVLGLSERQERGSCEGIEENTVQSILDWSYAEGKSVGIVTTTRVTHASPAAGYAHSPERNWESDEDIPGDKKSCVRDIASQLIEDNAHVQVIMGGGRREFLPNTTADPEYPDLQGERTDGKNLIQTWQDQMQQWGRKYKYAWNREQFQQIDPEQDQHVLALFEPSHMQYDLERNNNTEPTLAELVEKAIQILEKNSKGYFLFVEGGRIDHGHHAVWLKKALQDTVAFDDAVMKCAGMVNPSDTLIVVTADHSHSFTTNLYSARGNNILGFVDDTSNSWDGLPTTAIVYANGLTGIQINQTGRPNITGQDTTANDYRFPALIPTYSESHAGEDVPVFAQGPMAHLFAGVYEQNYIAHAMAYASCVGPNKEHCAGDADTPSTDNVATNTPTLALLISVIIHLLLKLFV